MSNSHEDGAAYTSALFRNPDFQRLGKHNEPYSLLHELRNRQHKNNMLIDANESERQRLFATLGELEKAIAALEPTSPASTQSDDKLTGYGTGSATYTGEGLQSFNGAAGQPPPEASAKAGEEESALPEGFTKWWGTAWDGPIYDLSSSQTVEVIFDNGMRRTGLRGAYNWAPDSEPRIFAYRIVETPTDQAHNDDASSEIDPPALDAEPPPVLCSEGEGTRGVFVEQAEAAIHQRADEVA